MSVSQTTVTDNKLMIKSLIVLFFISALELGKTASQPVLWHFLMLLMGKEWSKKIATSQVVIPTKFILKIAEAAPEVTSGVSKLQYI